jgi:hypothetical protein
VLLEADDLGPEAVAFVRELIDTFTQLATVSDGFGSVRWVYEAGAAGALSGTARAHPFCVRRPLAGPAHSSLTAHGSG